MIRIMVETAPNCSKDHSPHCELDVNVTLDDEFIYRFKAFRGKKGWDQAELAHQSGVSLSTIKKLESGANKNPRIETISTLAETLGVTFMELAQGVGLGPLAPDEYIKEMIDLRSRLDALEAKSIGGVNIPSDLISTLSNYTEADWNYIRSLHGLPRKSTKSEEESG